VTRKKRERERDRERGRERERERRRKELEILMHGNHSQRHIYILAQCQLCL